MGFLNKLLGTAELQQSIERNVKGRLGLRLNEDQSRLLAMAVVAYSVARFEPDAIYEQLKQGSHAGTAFLFVESFQLGEFIEDRLSASKYPFDETTTRDIRKRLGGVPISNPSRVQARTPQGSAAFMFEEDKMSFCVKCGASWTSDSNRFCGACGAAVAPRTEELLKRAAAGQREPLPSPRPFISDDWLLEFWKMADDISADPAWALPFKSWIVGAVGTANEVLGGIEALGSLWSGGRGQVLGVTRVLSLAMLARWARVVWAPRMSKEQLRLNVGNAAADVLDFFASGAPSHLITLWSEEFQVTDAQFNADMDTIDGESTRMIATELELGLLARELGRRLPAHLRVLPSPVESFQALSDSGWIPAYGFGDLLAADIALTTGGVTMFEWYKTNRS